MGTTIFSEQRVLIKAYRNVLLSSCSDNGAKQCAILSEYITRNYGHLINFNRDQINSVLFTLEHYQVNIKKKSFIRVAIQPDPTPNYSNCQKYLEGIVADDKHKKGAPRPPELKCQ